MNQDQDPLDLLKSAFSQLYNSRVEIEIKTPDSLTEEGSTDHYFQYDKELDFDAKKNLFYQIVNLYEKMLNSDILLENEFGINLSQFTENFYKIIDGLFLISLNKNIAQLLYFYFYERLNPDGSINNLVFEDGDETYERELTNVKDLFSIMLKLDPNIFK